MPKPDNVRVYGPGLEKATALEPAEFFVDATEAGDGDIGIAISGPAECEVNVEDNGDVERTTVFQAYNIDVKFAEEDVPGNPFEVMFLSPF